jgi:hypothetical protein
MYLITSLPTEPLLVAFSTNRVPKTTYNRPRKEVIGG